MSLLNQLQPPSYENRKSQHKAQSFGFKNGYPQCVSEKPGIGGEMLETTKLERIKETQMVAMGEPLYDPTLTFGSRVGTGAEKPDSSSATTIDADGITLRFLAYTKEDIEESQTENYRYRYVIIHFFLRDGSIMVTEPRVENSGLPQGKLVKRHHVPKPASDSEGGIYGLTDLLIGSEVNIYGVDYKIMSCDEFTMKKMKEMGFEMNQLEELPVDPYTSRRAALSEYKSPPKYDASKIALRKFLVNDRKVLRFYGVWDDRASMYGEMHKLVVKYFLVDDTIEVQELVGPNSGIEPFKLKRAKLSKKFKDVADIYNSECYIDEDFHISMLLNIYGRQVELHDCDEFTRTFYQNEYHREMTPITHYLFDST